MGDMYRAKVAVVALSYQALPSDAQAGTCEFDNEPVGVGYFWDPSCSTAGGLGCDADGKNIDCRYCGAGNYTIDCPPSSCQFQNEPSIPYYWEPGCGESVTSGCNADGKNVRCRYCGAGDYSAIDCPASQVCQFANEPAVPFFWDPSCTDGGLGCNADGIHQECRFCAVRPFQDVSCPGQETAEEACTWPVMGAPSVPSYWDPNCTLGDLGCWADGLHAGCRFCGEGVFATIPCPTTRRLDAAAFLV